MAGRAEQLLEQLVELQSSTLSELEGISSSLEAIGERLESIDSELSWFKNDSFAGQLVSGVVSLVSELEVIGSGIESIGSELTGLNDDSFADRLLSALQSLGQADNSTDYPTYAKSADSEYRHDGVAENCEQSPLRKFIDTAFSSMPSRANAQAIDGIDAVIQFKLLGEGGGEYCVLIHNNVVAVQYKAHAAPDLTITMQAEDFARAISGEAGTAILEPVLEGDINLMNVWRKMFTA